MESCSRLVKDEEYLLLLVLRTGLIERKEVRKLDTLALASGKGTAALPELDVLKSDLHQRLKPFSNPLGR